jgi:hypothetical protein
MQFEISRITIEVTDRESGRVVARELAPGSPWPCTPESLEEVARGGDTPVRGEATGKKKAKRSTTAEPKSKAKKSKKKTPKKKSSKPGKAPESRKSAKKSSKPLDLEDLDARQAYDRQILENVGRGPVSAVMVQQEVGGDRMQVLAGLSRLADAGQIERRGRGRGTRYAVPDAGAEDAEPAEIAEPEPDPEPVVLDPPRVRLRWRKQTIQGRATYVARFENGAFRIVAMISGAHSLYYEGDDDSLRAYGCGELKALKTVARELAAAGLPEPEAYRAAGGDLSKCPQPKRMRMGDVELVWRETIKEGRQLCVAPTGEGELRVMESDGGSFVLVFAREGDNAFDTLGCGSREELEVRALSLLAEANAEADADEPAAGETQQTEAPQGPVDETTDADESADSDAEVAAKDGKLVDSFGEAARKVLLEEE